MDAGGRGEAPPGRPPYVPAPIDTAGVALEPELLALTERLARHAHDVWARLRLEQGWRWGPTRDDARREHPALVPYEDLPETEKQADRETVLGTLQAIVALGYRIEPPGAKDRR
jgi:ryanodine receptor 2